MAPPMAKTLFHIEVNGIERAKDEWRRPNYGEITDGVCEGKIVEFPLCQCFNDIWENIDTNAGTGDNESFKSVLNQLLMILTSIKISFKSVYTLGMY